MNFLVHHQCFKNKKATELAFKSLREHNPDAPYILWSDSGDDYSNFSSIHDIDYFYSDINVGYRYYDKNKAYELLNRIRKSCELYPNLPFVVWMEDDVLVKGKIKIPDNVEFCGGPDVGNRYLGNAFEYICEKYKLSPNFDYYCTAGGTIMSSEVFTDKFNIIEKCLDEDYDYIINNLWTELSHHDIMIMTCHLICGKKYSVNPQHVDLSRSSNWRDEKFTIVHGYKNNY
jgi:hypothetical protein